MADTFSKAGRSRVMAAIRSRGNKATEMALVKLLRASGVKGWRRHVAMPGRPDFVFKKAMVAIFVDGCFWHGCAKHCRMPASNRKYWLAKITRNMERDRATRIGLRASGWKVIRVWEHELKARPTGVIARVFKTLHQAAIGAGSKNQS